MTTINIGLRRGTHGRAIPPQRALRILRAHGVEVQGYRVLAGAEPTLVATVRKAPDWKLQQVARELGQWAIARCRDGVGALVGPKAGAWGSFDPTLFQGA